VARVEEARRPAFRRLPALEPRLRRGHGEAALLERGADLLEVGRPPRATERAARALVRRERPAVVLARARVDAGHLDVEIERADVVAQRDEILLGDLAHLAELGGGAAAPAQEEDAAGGGRERCDERDPSARRAAVVAAALRGAAPAPPRGHGRDDVAHRRRDALDALAAMRVDRVVGDRAHTLARAVAPGAQPRPDDRDVGRRPADVARERAQHGVGIA
jgi:hypothetical protein